MEAEAWIREHVEPAGRPELTHERPWASVWRVPTAAGAVWFKACAPVQAFEPRLTAELARRHAALMPEVLAHDEARSWLLLGDLGAPYTVAGMTLEAYLELLPHYAELQIEEAAHVDDHLAHGVPDRRLSLLPDGLEELVAGELPIEPYELEQLHAFAPQLRERCAELDAFGIPATIQHDDLHGNNLYPHAGGTRILDWGDSSVAHPFFSFTQAFRHTPVEWHERMRDAYLEPWNVPAAAGDLGARLAWLGYAVALLRERAVHPPSAREAFDRTFAGVLREALAAT